MLKKMLPSVESMRYEATKTVTLLRQLASRLRVIGRAEPQSDPWVRSVANEIDAFADLGQEIREGLISCLLATHAAAADPSLHAVAISSIQTAREWSRLLEEVARLGLNTYRHALTRLADAAAVREEHSTGATDAAAGTRAVVFAADARAIWNVQREVSACGGAD